MKLRKWIAWLMILCLLLSGCMNDTPQTQSPTSMTITTPTTATQPAESRPSEPDDSPASNPPKPSLGHFQEADPWDAPKFEDMEYTRPDMEVFNATVASCTELAAGSDAEALLDAFEAYLVQTSNFITNYWLAYIRYNLNLSDEYWQQEHEFCTENMAQVESEMDLLLHTLADSPHRDYLERQEYVGEGFFDAYEGDSIWTEKFTALINQENGLEAEYYALVESNASVDQLAQLLVDMVSLRQQIATEAGYADYPSFAYDFYYQRDYSVAEVKAYLTDVQEQLVSLYQQAMDNDDWASGIVASNSKDTMAYTEKVAQAMGGSAEEAFRLLKEKELYHIRYGYKKLGGAFCVFLPDYMTPFVFVSPTGTSYDQLTLTHEFGHYARGFANGGVDASIDVEEIFSQGLENLSLFHGGEKSTAFRMMMSLSTYVEQGAYADFELRIYDLEPEELTVENLKKIYGDIKEDYALGTMAISFTEILHLYVEPLYVISYVTSNDAALQLYQMELADPGSGVKCYLDNLDNPEPQFMAFLDSVGLESPFAPGRILDVRETLEYCLR
ncbi:MAG: hypothetical protein IJB11_08180 [Oscillospiraceae bacterium]|nr:hypothetical protein [Oscillospiraceae bacterium]